MRPDMVEAMKPQRPRPGDCFYCEYDRKLDLPEGGWLYMGNNGPIVCCPVCNPEGKHPRS